VTRPRKIIGERCGVFNAIGDRSEIAFRVVSILRWDSCGIGDSGEAVGIIVRVCGGLCFASVTEVRRPRLS